MAGTSISSQLQAIKTVLNASTDPEPGRKRPLTRPSILFDAKTAADIDVDTILDIALSGLEVLITMDERFRNFKSDLFNPQSKELDRELVGQEENKRINASISSYLRLLSGYLELPSSLKTLEYLIRRYKVHVYNVDDLILCALPYHDTHVFVQIVQLINTGNSKWKFLDGVKSSGARPPREIIVQQCIRDMGVLEAICNYATPLKKIQPSKHVIGFCTAVIFEVLGLIAVDSDTVKRILPYVNSGLQLGARGPNQKAGALMIVSLLAQKAALAPNVVKSLMHSVADAARTDAKETGDLLWLRMSLMTLINIVQLQSVELIPKKTAGILNEIRDISVILLALTKEFNIDRFFAVFLDSILEYSASDDSCHHTLLSIIETVPMKGYVNRIVTKLLATRTKISQDKINLVSSESENRGKHILMSICKKYPNETRGAFYTFLKDGKVKSKKMKSSYDLLCNILDEHLESSNEIPDPKIFFALEHSEAEIRRSAVLGLDVVSILREKAAGSKGFDAIQDALFRRLNDDDLIVVLEVLNLKNLSEILSPSLLIEALQSVLQRCIEVLLSSSSKNASLPMDAALLCLQQIITTFKDQEHYAMTLATTIFPLVLIRPKTQRLNLKALELAAELKWPFFKNLVHLPGSNKKLEAGNIISFNIENISKLAETFSSNPEEYIPWLVKCCSSYMLSKTLSFLVLLQSLKMLKMDFRQFSAFFDSCFPILKNEWEKLESLRISTEQSKKTILDRDCKEILEDVLSNNNKDVNAEILACLFLRLSEAFVSTAPQDASLDMKGKWVCSLQDLFLFFACNSKDAFRKHLEYLSAKCKKPMARIMLKLFAEEGVPYAAQIESLRSFGHICSQSEESLALQLLEEFPSVLVLLLSDNQDVRVASMSCIEELFEQWSRLSRNGNSGFRVHFLGELLRLIIQQKKMILSDKNVLTSFFTSLLSSSSDSLLAQQAVTKRFTEPTKDDALQFMLGYALGLPVQAKLKLLSLVKGVGSKLLSMPGVRSLLNDLLERRFRYYLGDKLCRELSKCEVEILCLLLESCTRLQSSHGVHDLGDFIIKTLWVNGAEDHAVLEPCITILGNLSSSLYGDMKIETQELIFRNLLVLLRTANGDIQNLTRDTLLRLNLNCSIVGRVLDSILDQKTSSVGSTEGKRQRKSTKCQNTDQRDDATHNRENNTLPFISAFLDALRMKKDIENRTSLVGPLFKLLHVIFTNDEWMPKAADKNEARESGFPESDSDIKAYIRQTLLLTLEDISASIGNNIPNKDIAGSFDLQLLVSCARSSCDAVTRNHVFSLITTLAKIFPDKVLDKILDILTAVGESTVTQWDSYSQHVFEGLISAIIPCWLSRINNMEQLLQIFVNILPQVTEHRRLSIVTHILRTLGEAGSLGSLLFLLFQSLISRNNLFLFVNGPSLDQLTPVINKQWEYEFGVQLCEQYSCTIWLPSLILTLKKIGSNNLSKKIIMQMVVAVQFVADKLRDPEISLKFDSGEDLNNIQLMVGELMEQVVFHLQLVDSKKKKIGVPAVIRRELKEYIRAVLKTLTRGLKPSTYFDVIIKLIGHADTNVRQKALGLLCETVKDLGVNAKINRKGLVSSLRNSWLYLDDTSLNSFDNLCLAMLTVVDSPNDVPGTSLKLTAVSAIEVLANRFSSHDSVYSVCLGSICENISSDYSALSSHCLRATGALINALGPKALSELPSVMESVLKKSREVSSVAANSTDSLFMAILLTLEAVVNKLAGFLNPYLGDILRLVILHPLSFSTSELKLKLKADVVRKLITEKIPVRLLLPPVLLMYSDAIKSGESSLSIVFEMLGNLIGSMDRSSIGVYHAKVFDLCLLALDLRHQNPPSIQNIDVVEQNVINAIVTLTMKLTETMFRPLFIKTIEWSGLNVEGDENTPGKVNNRAISFYSLVNKLAESHRSLFIHYFKYLLDGCVRHLVDNEDTKTGLIQKKKKAKLSNHTKDADGALSLQVWHIRALVLSSLHKCFLYDTGSLKFLDPSNFQVLLKPIVSQLVMDPPVSIENHPNIPSVKEVDDLLVTCVGQMAVTAGSDLLWKPLNHEVLMQTRSEKTRARILGLKIVKYLVDNLKEEYLQFLPESIPFLGELLEDVELPVKSLAQEILKEMETLSGESLREYL